MTTKGFPFLPCAQWHPSRTAKRLCVPLASNADPAAGASGETDSQSTPGWGDRVIWAIHAGPCLPGEFRKVQRSSRDGQLVSPFAGVVFVLLISRIDAPRVHAINVYVSSARASMVSLLAGFDCLCGLGHNGVCEGYGLAAPSL